MSKTIGHGTGHKINGVKYPWFDYMSKRPCSFLGIGKSVKKLTHKIERAIERSDINKERMLNGF